MTSMSETRTFALVFSSISAFLFARSISSVSIVGTMREMSYSLQAFIIALMYLSFSLILGAIIPASAKYSAGASSEQSIAATMPFILSLSLASLKSFVSSTLLPADNIKIFISFSFILRTRKKFHCGRPFRAYPLSSKYALYCHKYDL